MAVRAINAVTFVRCCAALPPITTVRYVSRHDSFHFQSYSCLPACCRLHLRLMSIEMPSLLDMRKRCRVRASYRLELKSSEEFLENKLGKQALRKGLLLEFRKDAERLLLAVVQKPDGKKNWMVSDQNGFMTSIKPQQVTFIVPGIEDFDHTEISQFVQTAQENLDPALLEFAWIELLENNKSTTVEELAEMIYGASEPLDSYSAHLLLSRDDIYFTTLETSGSYSIYGPRPAVQVEELRRRKTVKENAEKELEEFINILKSARDMPRNAKPPRSAWTCEDRIRIKIETIQAFAIETCWKEDEKRTVGMILNAMGLARTSSAAASLLMDIGYFPVHMNLDLLKLHTDHSKEILAAADVLLSDVGDIDEVDRIDLTHMKVYAIDVDEADEVHFLVAGSEFFDVALELSPDIEFLRHVQLDDALSASRLQDGRIKVWIHIADPTRLVQPGSVIDRDARKRGTSVFLPTVTYPMFPEKLAMNFMSLKQGELCKAVTVSVVLHPDGSISEYMVENSTIKPTYMLTYEGATELILLNLEEEPELRLLSEAATLRFQWRQSQGAMDTSTIDTRIKVTNPDDPEPLIKLYVENQAEPAMRLVSEMMILCGEVIATLGFLNKIPLPYRGQPQSNIDLSAFLHLPEGPVRSFAIVKTLRAAEMDFRKPIRHGVLGLSGYVQFTSPIRRYMDLVAHYQVKAFLRGDALPFSAGEIEGIASMVNMNTRLVKRIASSSLRYWLIEYLRRQPEGKKFSALILRFIKDRVAAVLLMEVGLQASTWVSVGVQVGDEVKVMVEDARPRDDIITVKEVIA